MQKRFQGSVIWYDSDNGHGIIRIHTNQKTVSIADSQIHHDTSGNIRPLRVGQTVSFEIVDTRAHNLYIL